MNELLIVLTKMCKNHDWYYEFADDHGVWKRGSAERWAIHAKLKECEDAGLGEEATKIFKEHQPNMPW